MRPPVKNYMKSSWRPGDRWRTVSYTHLDVYKRQGKGFYLKGLNTFLVRQIGSKIRTNYLVVTIVCGLLTITIRCV